MTTEENKKAEEEKKKLEKELEKAKKELEKKAMDDLLMNQPEVWAQLQIQKQVAFITSGIGLLAAVVTGACTIYAACQQSRASKMESEAYKTMSSAMSTSLSTVSTSNSNKGV